MRTGTTLLGLVLVVALLLPSAVAAPGATSAPGPGAEAGTGAGTGADASTGGAVAQGEMVTLTVEVVDQLGNPIGGVTVNATWDGGNRVVDTASNGKAFVDVPAGEDVTLRIEDGRYVRNEPFVIRDVSEADAEEDVEVDVALKASLTLRVANATGPVPDATVRLLRDGRVIAGGETDAGGGFASGTIEQGEYVLVVRKTGHFPIRREIDVRRTDERDIDLEAGTATVTVEVRDDHFSPAQPVGNASVRVAGIGTQRTVSGTATFAVPVYSEHEVTVTKEEYGTARLSVAVEEDDRTVGATISRDPEVVIEPVNRRIVVGETVEVRVVNAYGEPIEGATVQRDGEEAGETGADGRVRVRIEESGEQELRARSGGLASAPVTVTGIAEPADATATAAPSPTPSPSPTPATDTPEAALFDVSELDIGPVTVLIGVALLFVLLFVVRYVR